MASVFSTFSHETEMQAAASKHRKRSRATNLGMRIKPVLQTWARTLRGNVPSLSIEITKECPLRCPGCYAYEDHHLGTTNLRSLADFRNDDLIDRVLKVVGEH